MLFRSSFEWNAVPYDVPDLYAKPGTPCDNYNGYCDAFQSCREVDPSGPLATLRRLLLSNESMASLKRWFNDQWFYVAILALVILLVVVSLDRTLSRTSADQQIDADWRLALLFRWLSLKDSLIQCSNHWSHWCFELTIFNQFDSHSESEKFQCNRYQKPMKTYDTFNDAIHKIWFDCRLDWDLILIWNSFHLCLAIVWKRFWSQFLRSEACHWPLICLLIA